MGFVEKDGKIELKTTGELKRLVGYMDISINGMELEHVGVLWDTGATDTAVDKGLFDKIPDAKLDSATMSTFGGTVLKEYFEGDVRICDEEIKDLRIVVNEGLKSEHYVDIVFGMDIIQHGKMIIDGTGEEKKFQFSLRK
jgi:hypothetical protein